MSPTSTSEGPPPAGGPSGIPGADVVAALEFAPPRPPRPWLGFTVDAALAILLLLVASVLLVMPFVLIGMAGQPPGVTTEETMQGLLPQVTVAAIVAMLLASLATWALRGRAMGGELARMPLWPALAWALLAGIAIQAIVLAVDAGLRSIDAPLSPSNAEPLLALNRQWPWLTWVMVVLVGPFAGELLFRHVLLRRFAVAGKAVAGLLATSALFALLHELGQGAERHLAAWLGILAVYLAMGMGFGLVYLRTGRFWAAFVAHAACNATAMTLSAFST